MPRHEESREDLLAEAKALVERIALKTPHGEAVVGFRTGGAASIYFGEDPAFHFNRDGQLRRVYRNGQLLKAEDRRLVALIRRRTDLEVQLLRHELTPDETADLRADIRTRVRALADVIHAQTYEVVGQVPIGVDVLPRVCGFLAKIAGSVEIAASPGVA